MRFHQDHLKIEELISNDLDLLEFIEVSVTVFFMRFFYTLFPLLRQLIVITYDRAGERLLLLCALLAVPISCHSAQPNPLCANNERRKCHYHDGYNKLAACVWGLQSWVYE